MIIIPAIGEVRAWAVVHGGAAVPCMCPGCCMARPGRQQAPEAGRPPPPPGGLQGESGSLDGWQGWLGFGLSVVSMLSTGGWERQGGAGLT